MAFAYSNWSNAAFAAAVLAFVLAENERRVAHADDASVNWDAVRKDIIAVLEKDGYDDGLCVLSVCVCVFCFVFPIAFGACVCAQARTAPCSCVWRGTHAAPTTSRARLAAPTARCV